MHRRQQRERARLLVHTHTLHDPDDGIKRTVHEKVLLEELTVLVIGIGVSGSVEETVKE